MWKLSFWILVEIFHLSSNINQAPLAGDAKGGDKEEKRGRIIVFPSIPKEVIVGIVVIDEKWTTKE